ncbi:outer membrane beta-barrel family protein [Pedobacter punctiformis]|uniref:Outer membrane beta-barrel family protein n=1 Tax=Pedobacter punctiformis TaxID=3004097 RepID=A0ABT4L8S9_9SPHI|nr:outer membrane beta-barrel family protein [Pedobacter sp. HCMS5-2]MCZ4244256.1 outer membrane beta-barrel family protein [Pedobacter sp. HCMS5-2]
MKQILFLLAAIVFQINVFGQQYSLKGKVVNQNKIPVELVYASLLKNDSIMVKQAPTDSLGNFSISVEHGNYRLILEQFGTEFIRREIILTQNIDLGHIEINEAKELQGVTVSGRKKILEQKVDRLVFNVENSIAASGGTALDALKVTPTVRVQNDNVSIIGKGEVLVMIDDRLQRIPQEDLADFLKSIPSANIKSIEVITAPPAKYDAEGNSGLINIKLKSAKDNSWNANIGASYIQKTYAGGNLQGLFNYNHNKLSLQASVNKSEQKLLTTSNSQIFYTDELWNQEVKNKSKSDALSLGFGIDYKLTPKWTTGIKYLGSFTDKTSANNPLITRFNNTTAVVNSYIASGVDASNKPEMNSLNWYHSFSLDSSGKNITVDFDYFNYRKQDYSFFAGNELDAQSNAIQNTFFSSTNTNVNKIKNYSGKIDVSLPYKWANISFGTKISYTNTNNDLVVYNNQTGTPIQDNDQSNIFNYKEHNGALYFSTDKKLNSQWETQIGLRMEATQTEGYSKNLSQTNKNNYINLFPTAYVTYVPNENNSFSFNYSRRIRRPDFDYLNPFVIKTSPYYYSEGNPFLKPSFIDNLEFSFIRKQNWVNSLYFSQVSNFGQELAIVNPATNITKSTSLNYANTYQIGFSTYYNFKKWSWLNSVSGFNVNYQNVKSKINVVQSIDGYNGYIYTNNDFTLNKSKSVFLGLNYALQLPGRYQIFHISTMNMLDASMKFLLLNKNLSLTVIGEDLLNAQKPLIAYKSNGIKNNIKSYGDTRGFRVSVSYKFGNASLKSKQRNFGNDDERNRTVQ